MSDIPQLEASVEEKKRKIGKRLDGNGLESMATVDARYAYLPGFVSTRYRISRMTLAFERLHLSSRYSTLISFSSARSRSQWS
jgi:hypothetical protein